MANLKIGIMGALRGNAFMQVLKVMEGADFVALCETSEESLKEAQRYLTSDVKVYSDYDEFISSGLDGVILCNYFHEHAECAIKAFKEGVAVLSETTAANTLGECVELVEACEKYNGKYMLAANCLYFRAVHAMKQRIQSGKSGKILYGEAEYIHGPMGNEQTDNFDMENLHWRQTMPSNMYNMHSLGPLMYVTESEPETVCCTMISNENVARKMSRVTDTVGSVVITQMNNGAVFNTTGCSEYQPTSKWYRIAAENETMESDRYDKRIDKLIIAKDSDNLEVLYPNQYDAGLMTRDMNIAMCDVNSTGHGGIDYFATYHFLKLIKGEETPFFDVYRSTRLSAVGILGWYSALCGGKTLRVPDFRKKEDRDRVRHDYRSTIAKKYGDLTLPCRLDEAEGFELNLDL